MRTIHSANQLSIHGAVSSWCIDLSGRMQGQNLLEWMCPFQKKTKRVITTAESARNWFFGKKLTKDSKICGKMAENQKKVGFSSLQHGDNAIVWVVMSRSSSRHVDELRYREPETPLEEVAQECVQDQEKESSTRWKVRRPCSCSSKSLGGLPANEHSLRKQAFARMRNNGAIIWNSQVESS